MSTVLDKPPKAAEVKDQLWTFTYKVGPAPKSGTVRAKDEDEGYRVACEWCRQNELRAPAKVFPMILADATILTPAK